jgi:hypothetical protein
MGRYLHIIIENATLGIASAVGYSSGAWLSAAPYGLILL